MSYLVFTLFVFKASTGCTYSSIWVRAQPPTSARTHRYSRCISPRAEAFFGTLTHQTSTAPPLLQALKQFIYLHLGTTNLSGTHDTGQAYFRSSEKIVINRYQLILALSPSASHSFGIPLRQGGRNITILLYVKLLPQRGSYNSPVRKVYMRILHETSKRL